MLPLDPALPFPSSAERGAPVTVDQRLLGAAPVERGPKPLAHRTLVGEHVEADERGPAMANQVAGQERERGLDPIGSDQRRAQEAVAVLPGGETRKRDPTPPSRAMDGQARGPAVRTAHHGQPDPPSLDRVRRREDELGLGERVRLGGLGRPALPTAAMSWLEARSRPRTCARTGGEYYSTDGERAIGVGPSRRPASFPRPGDREPAG